MSNNAELIVKGWRIFAHPLFCQQFETLTYKVERLRTRDAENYRGKNSAKRLAAIQDLIWKFIPKDPSRLKYRQEKTLGKNHKHWYRAKFFQQYRLFFRYQSEQKIIVYGWVNDPKTKRAYKSDTDAYYVFAKLLNSGNPPTDWDELLEACKLQESGLKELAPDDLDS